LKARRVDLRDFAAWQRYDAVKKYVDYMTGMSVDFLVDFGLGDWCPPTGGPAGFKCPSIVTVNWLKE
jgi:hypothetical protein